MNRGLGLKFRLPLDIYAYRTYNAFMTSPARIAANRRNAKNSTGPRTAEGKAIASQNALRHGLTAGKLLCDGEHRADFASFAEGLRGALGPADEVEEQLVERIILTSWRLRRTARAEAGLVSSWAANTYPDHLYGGETTVARLFSARPDNMTALSRYETALDRTLGRAYALLERRQAARRGEDVPPPMTVLVEAIGADVANPLHPQQKSENYETNPMRDVTPRGDATP